MKIQIPRSQIVDPVSTVCSVAKTGKTDHILENVLLGIKDGFLFFTANDSSKQLTAKVSLSDLAAESDEPFLVNAKKLQSIIKAAPESANITFEYKNNECTVRYGRSRFKLKALPPKGDSAFPLMVCKDIRAGYFVEPKELKQQLTSCDYAMGKDDVHHYLNGLHIELDDGVVSYTASNGHVLAKTSHEVKSKGDKTAVILPNTSVKYLEKLAAQFGCQAVKVLFNTVTLQVESADYIFVAKLVDGQYPDVQRVIPDTTTTKAIIDTQAIRDSVQRASVIGSTSLELSFAENVLTIRAGIEGKDESTQEVDVQLSGTTEPIRVNTGYLNGTLQALSSVAEKVELCINNSTTAFLVNAAGVPVNTRTHVVMPMRV